MCSQTSSKSSSSWTSLAHCREAACIAPCEWPSRNAPLPLTLFGGSEDEGGLQNAPLPEMEPGPSWAAEDFAAAAGFSDLMIGDVIEEEPTEPETTVDAQLEGSDEAGAPSTDRRSVEEQAAEAGGGPGAPEGERGVMGGGSGEAGGAGAREADIEEEEGEDFGDFADAGKNIGNLCSCLACTVGHLQDGLWVTICKVIRIL